ncbi:6-bladed beta-propeller [uncultured Maribacter sp.]|uniref:6-bladed beta-propeller n=1 Tax=uncultured Maribacter sp. TaxID=431308 RepID=UPI002615CEED|nr:6-bladed beta-propeller [uncultured Maribacter sp.]
MKKITLITLSFFFLFSCDNKNKSKKKDDLIFSGVKKSKNIIEIKIDSLCTDIIKIPNVDSTSKLYLSKFIDSVRLLKLETTEKSIIGKIDKIIVKNKSVYILDAFVTKGIYEFSIDDGSFIRKYGNFGKGPSEYIYPVDFNIDKNELIILDNNKSKLLVYDLNGKFKRKLRLGFRALKFIIDKDGRYIYYTAGSPNYYIDNSNNFLLLIGNGKGNIKYKAFSTLPIQHKFSFLGSNSLIINNDNPMFHFRYDNNIYIIEGNKIRPFLYFDFGEEALPKDYDHNINHKEFVAKYHGIESPYLTFSGNYLINNNHMFFTYNKSNRLVTSIYSFKTKEIISGTILSSENFKKGFGTFSPTTIYKDFFVSYANSYEIIKNKELLKKFRDEETNNLIKETTEYDNPIIVFQKLKEF